jgi:hypothetical protein
MKIATAMPDVRGCLFCDGMTGFRGKTRLFEWMPAVLGG